MTKLFAKLPIFGLLVLVLFSAFPVQKASAQVANSNPNVMELNSSLAKPAGVFSPVPTVSFSSPADGASVSTNKTTVSLNFNRNGNTTIVGRDLHVEIWINYKSTFPNSLLRVPGLYQDYSATYSKPVKFATTSDTTVALTFTNVPLTYGQNDIYVIVIDDATLEKVPVNDTNGIAAKRTINYTGKKAPVYRFWSAQFKGHFFTLDPSMVTNSSLMQYWAYEGFAYYADYQTVDANSKPVHRFWSDAFQHHFFTLDPSMKDDPNLNKIWKYEIIAFYATSQGAPGAVPVYRFWSSQFRAHFFTLDNSMKDNPQLNQIWAYEGVAYYAYSK